MAWVYLLLAGLLEIAWMAGMKYSDGFSRLVPSVLTVAALVGSFILLLFAIRTIPMGTAYAVWTGVGAAGAAIVGILLFDEPADLARLLCVAVVVAGVVGLKLTSPA
ncbi:MAG TPA: quaternary ammonium compound efflux SMR transporter SugE [Planctomycetota bacterium]|nr:quaternary ammonium compound efflux SMR transporter SugE [Planctomycetota bacterium]